MLGVVAVNVVVAVAVAVAVMNGIFMCSDSFMQCLGRERYSTLFTHAERVNLSSY